MKTAAENSIFPGCMTSLKSTIPVPDKLIFIRESQSFNKMIRIKQVTISPTVIS
jgi:hypothetical protein